MTGQAAIALAELLTDTTRRQLEAARTCDARRLLVLDLLRTDLLAELRAAVRGGLELRTRAELSRRMHALQELEDQLDAVAREAVGALEMVTTRVYAEA